MQFLEPTRSILLHSCCHHVLVEVAGVDATRGHKIKYSSGEAINLELARKNFALGALHHTIKSINMFMPI